MSDTHTQLVEQLTLVARQIEEHRTAIWLLEQRQQTLREQLRSADWKPPAVPLDCPSPTGVSDHAR